MTDRFFHRSETQPLVGWSRPAPRPRSPLALALETALVACSWRCAFPRYAPTASAALPQKALPAARFAAALAPGQEAELHSKARSILRLSPSAEPRWHHRPPSEHERRQRSQPPESIQPPPGSNRASVAVARWQSDGALYPPTPATSFSVSLLSADVSASISEQRPAPPWAKRAR